MYNQKHVGVIIPAAGSSSRMGTGVKKQFFELAGKPVWVHTLEKFHECREVDSIVLAVPPDALATVGKKVGAYPKVHAVVEGGDHRQDSVRNALESIKPLAPDILLVHDVVRPFVSVELIIDVIKSAELHRAVVPAVQPKETVKISNGNGFVEATSDRSTLWLVQTPQGFQSSLLYEAFDRAYQDGFYGTDEASLVERVGVRVKIIRGSYRNVKITTVEDLELAQFLAKQVS